MLQRTQLQEGSNQYSVIKNLLFFLPSLAQRSAALPFPHKLQSAPFCGKGRGPDYRGLGLQAASGHCLLRSTRGFVGMWRELGRCQVVQVNDSTTASHLHVKYWWAPARAADISSWRQFHPWTCTRLCSDAMREAWGGWAQQSTELCATTAGCLTPWMDPGELSVFGGRERGSGEAQQQQQLQLDSGIIFSPS